MHLSGKLGPGPRGEQTLVYDMHAARLREKLLNDPELLESLRFVLSATSEFLARQERELLLTGMEIKAKYYQQDPTALEHGKAVMMSAADRRYGGGTATDFIEDTLDI